MRNRVLDGFTGAQSLVECAETLVDNPTRYDLAVVRGVDQVVRDDWNEQSAVDTDTNIAMLYELVPELRLVDAVVQKAAQARREAHILGEGQIVPDRTSRAYVRSYTIAPHADPDKRMILTGSIRTDSNFHTTRTFWARQEGIETFKDGAYDHTAFDIITGSAGYIKNLQQRKWDRHMSYVDQRPGDWIWVLNHPQPAIHAVTTSPGDTPVSATRALITTYHQS